MEKTKAHKDQCLLVLQQLGDLFNKESSNEVIKMIDIRVDLLKHYVGNIKNLLGKEDRQIVLNQIQTPDGTILRSMHRHDYVTYTDKNGLEYMVDGGQDYLRRNAQHPDAPYKELTVYSNEPFEVIRENLHRGGRGKNGDEPLKYVPLNEMSDSWVKAAITYNEELGMDKHYSTEMYRKELEYRKENNISITEN